MQINPVYIQQQQQWSICLAVNRFNVISCIRHPGVCGGRLLPALYPSPQPYQPGGDQRQTGVHEDREGWCQGKFQEDCVVQLHAFCFHVSYSLLHVKEQNNTVLKLLLVIYSTRGGPVNTQWALLLCLLITAPHSCGEGIADCKTQQNVCLNKNIFLFHNL